MNFRGFYIVIFLLSSLLCLSQNNIQNTESDFVNELQVANEFYRSAMYDSSLVLFKKLNDEAVSSLDINEFIDFKIKLINSYLKERNYPQAASELIKTLSFVEEKNYQDHFHRSVLCYLNGEVLYRQGQYDKCREVLSVCLSNIHQSSNDYDSLKVLMLKNLGNADLRSGNSAGALQKYMEAREIEKSRKEQPGPLLGSIFLNLAIAYNNIKEFDSADVYFLKSIEIKSKYSTDKASLAASYVNYSNFLINFGRTNKALTYLDLADEIYKSNYGDDFQRLGFIYLSHAKIYALKNDYRQALDYFTKSENVYRIYLNQGNSRFENIKLNMAVIYKYMSQYQKSIQIYDSDVLVNSSNPKTQVMRLRNKGECYLLLGENEKAYGYLKDAMEKAIVLLGKDHIQTATSYVRISDYYATIGDKSNTVKYLEKSLRLFIEYFGPDNREVTNVYNTYCINLLKIGEFMEAAQKAQQAIISITPEFSETSIFTNPDFGLLQNDYHAVAALALKTNALAEMMLQYPNDRQYTAKTLETALLGIRLFEVFKATLAEENSQLYNTEKINILFQSATHAALRMYETTGEYHYLDLAFQQSEKNKATILASGMTSLDKGLKNHVPDSIMQKEQNIKQELRAFSSHIYEENKKQQKDSLKLVWLQNKLFDLRVELDNHMQHIASVYPKYYDLKNTHEVTTIADLQAQLDSNELLIEYALLEDHIIIFVISSDNAHTVMTKSTNDFRSNVENYLSLLRKPPSFDTLPKVVIREYVELSYSIYQELIQPIEGIISGKELIIIPDDVLGYMPFGSLVTSPLNEHHNNFRKLPYLIKDHPVSYHYSSTLFINQMDGERKQIKPVALLMAPIYRFENRPEDSSVYTRLDYLNNTVEEVKSIHKIIGGRLFMDSLATEGSFKANASDFSILHLAMHAELEDEDPMASKLIFTPTRDSAEDGFLNTYEIYDLKLNTELVVLSACESGTGELKKGEGIMSMARGFIFAGTPSLLMSHWQVNDSPTNNVMNGFYSNLGIGKRKALQQSKLNHISNSDLLFSHPYYWSPFVLIGDDAPINAAKPKSYLIVLFVIGVGVMFLLFVISRRK